MSSGIKAADEKRVPGLFSASAKKEADSYAVIALLAECDRAKGGIVEVGDFFAGAGLTEREVQEVLDRKGSIQSGVCSIFSGREACDIKDVRTKHKKVSKDRLNSGLYLSHDQMMILTLFEENEFVLHSERYVRD